MPDLRVIEPGLFTTVQDLGRPGYGAIGVPPSGAADTLSLAIGNRLVGNVDAAAALECTLSGPTLTLQVDAWVSLTGASCVNATVEGKHGDRPLPWCEPTRVRSGETIVMGRTDDGARAYLCLSGGVSVDPVLGSRSTLGGSSLGGHKGRALRAGDELSLGETGDVPRSVPSSLHALLRSKLHQRSVRVVRSLHSEHFPSEAYDILMSSRFVVFEQSNRIGVRLEGPAIPLPPDAGSFDSEPTMTGAMQVSGDGRAIILGPDRPTTGGYPLIACVVEADIPVLAMLRPRDSVRIVLISINDARQAIVEQRRAIDRILPPSKGGLNT